MTISSRRLTKIIAASVTALFALTVILGMMFNGVAQVMGAVFITIVAFALLFAVYKLLELMLGDIVDKFMENRENKARRKRIEEFENEQDKATKA